MAVFDSYGRFLRVWKRMRWEKLAEEEFFSKNAIDKKDCVWIVTDRSQVKTADEVHVAAAGQMDMGTQYAFESLKEVDAQYLDKIRMRYNGIPWVIGYTKRCMIRELSLSDIPATAPRKDSLHL